jgi:methylmalonyl-CoA mutase N-terminal domain/subunit
VRTTIEALAAVLGGAQSIHTNAYDEALALPTEDSARVALRTQQLLAHEAGVADVADPLGGSYAVETLTNELEARAAALIADIDRRGGMVAAIEAGWPQAEIAKRAFEHQAAVESGARVIVGVNKFTEGDAAGAALHRLDPALEATQAARVAAFRAARDGTAAEAVTRALGTAARGRDNLLPFILRAVKARATLGEIADALREVFGEYRPG